MQEQQKAEVAYKDLKKFKKVLHNKDNIIELTQYEISEKNKVKQEKFHSQRKLEKQDHNKKLKEIEDRLLEAEQKREKEQ